MLLLRPHHINCIFFYRGLGYSKEFVNKMDEILDFLKRNPNSIIKLTAKCDTLCLNCPNKTENNICITEKKVMELDKNTLHTYKLKENQEYPFNEIINNIYKNFDSKNFNEICSVCNWYKEGVCTSDIIKDQLLKWNFNKVL